MPDDNDNPYRFKTPSEKESSQDFLTGTRIAEKSYEQLKLEQAVRDARPSSLTQGPGRPLEPRRTINEPRRTDAPVGSVQRHELSKFESAAAQTTQQIQSQLLTIEFLLRNASTTTDGNVTYKVKVLDGKIQGVFPLGMGTGSYTLTLLDPSDSLIYAGATFNPTTLAITSRFLGVSGSGDYPEARVESDTSGFLYWLLGFTYLDTDDAFKLVQTRTGRIYVTLIYGSQNGQQALWAGEENGWLDLALL